MAAISTTNALRKLRLDSPLKKQGCLHLLFCSRASKLVVFLYVILLFCSYELDLAIEDAGLAAAAKIFDFRPFAEMEAGLDPCKGRARPPLVNASAAQPPTLYFLHIPKTAGTLMYQIVLQYAKKTRGLPCQFLFDGNRWEVEEFGMSLLPPPDFPPSSKEYEAVSAYKRRDKKAKSRLYRSGVCRIVRGHVTYRQRDAIQAPVISFTVVRNPLERFVSMYEFVRMMVDSRPGVTGWDQWVSGASLESELKNASSIFNKGFYDKNGRWLGENNIGFSFHFYGVLHQLSGINPVFSGVGDPSSFTIENAYEMAEKAKDNLCTTHVLGSQDNVPETLNNLFTELSPYAEWTPRQQAMLKSAVSNRNRARKSRDIAYHLSPGARQELERRLLYEIEVYEFAKRIIQFRKRQREMGDPAHARLSLLQV